MGEASRRRTAWAQDTAPKDDRLAALAVTADAFARSIRKGQALVSVFEANGFDPGLFSGSGLVAFLPGVDDRGRALSLMRRDSGRAPLRWRYEWRTRALARFTSVERRCFVAAVRTYPEAAQGTVREARAAFASDVRGPRARDLAAMEQTRG